MAENENGQEKTEEPTGRKIEKAREDGQVARSKELNTTFVLVGGVLGLLIMGESMADALIGIMRYSFTVSREAAFDGQLMLRYLKESAEAAFIAIIPFLGMVMVAGLIGPVALGGWLISAKALMPKFNRMDPIKGLGRMFSMNALMELVKALAKFALVAGIAVLVLSFYQGELLTLGMSAFQPAIVHSLEVVIWSILAISASTVVIAFIDVPYQIYDNNKKLKMTLQEVKDEMKDSEGKPEVKGRIRQLQREMAQRRMMEAVPDADVVITNPEHFSVALKYNVNGSGAPIVVAKGIDHLALKIREIANAHDVLIMQSPPLARAIYFTSELDEEIPGSLYLAVAQVLAYVFQLKAYKAGEGKRPQPLAEITVPDEVKYDINGHLSPDN